LAAAKAAALGRREPKALKGEQLLQQCIQMATRLGILQRRGTWLDTTPTANEILARGPIEDLGVFFRLLWQTFPLFRSVVTRVCSTPQGFLLPVDRSTGRFSDAASRQGLDADHISFEIVRDLATDLKVLNWHPVITDAQTQQKVYAVGSLRGSTHTSSACAMEARPSPLADLARAQNAPVYDAHLPPEYPCLFVGNPLDPDAFERNLWREYLLQTDRVPRFPVLYSVVRDAVCEALRISDAAFDDGVSGLIEKPHRLNIYPAAGILDYASKVAITYKQIPPRTATGQFMTFLKIDRRSA
jgi:hypothetical protein